MKLSKKIVVTIPVLIAVALVGLMCLQIVMFIRAAELELWTFRQNANAALNSIVQKLETRDMLVKVMEVSEEGVRQEGHRVSTIVMEPGGKKSTLDRKIRKNVLPQRIDARIDSNRITFHLQKPQRVRLVVLDSLGKELAEVVDEFKPVGEHEIELPESQPLGNEISLKLFIGSEAYVLRLMRGSSKEITIVEDPASDERRLALVRKVVDEFTTFTPVLIESRIKPAVLDSIVRITLEENGIRFDYGYGIVSTETDSVILVNPSEYRESILQSEYRTQLYPHDVFVESNDLVLYFPRQRMALFKQLGLSAFSTLVFIGVIVFCFVYVIRAILVQRRMSHLLVDFINNMTHEFKTPISTIFLASETLSQKSVMKDKSRLKKYGKIIQDESSRMRDQVEKILEMAALEEGDFDINKTSVDLHELIREAVDKFTLAVENRKGRISVELKAGSHLVEADAVHIRNVIHNMLDNAMKYTRENPEILISTTEEGDCIKIAVEDNGIGLNPEEKKRVFDKYYRVPTGDVHDVKGFGLGLSYVKLIVEAHEGTVSVKSEPGRGSVFTITLPSSEQTS